MKLTETERREIAEDLAEYFKGKKKPKVLFIDTVETLSMFPKHIDMPKINSAELLSLF